MAPKDKKLIRCPWVPLDDPEYVRYHDREWGVPLHDDRAIFEFLLLEVFQAGLSWRIVLRKRKNFARAFANFNYKKIASFTAPDVARLMKDEGIIRNQAKIKATINNAKCFIQVAKDFGSFSKYMWSFVGARPIDHKIKSLQDYQAQTPESITWSKDLKRRGFKFLGSTTLYAHMQAVGMVNDHAVSCFRHKEV